MSPLRFPLKDHLHDPVDEAALHRVATSLDSRQLLGARRPVLPFVLGGVFAAALLATFILARGHRDAGPLRLADGHDLVSLTAGETTRELFLSDGSRIRLSPGARLEPLDSTGTFFAAIVTQGRADFDVRPGGPRHWVVECGLATVEVIGTGFSCERGPGLLRVAVTHGVVLVRGERVPERARRLVAGQNMDITDEALRPLPAAEATPPISVPPTPVAPAGASSLPTAPAERAEGSRSRAPAGKTWRDLARHGRHGEAFAILGSDGLRRESRRLGVDDLLALADVARLSGHPAEAVLPLERILAEFAGDPQAPLAAFALGRLELDSLGHARAAASAFRRALALGIPRGLREDVCARLVEAFAKSGDLAAAQRAAEAYAAEFPGGRHENAIAGWLRRR